MGPLAEEQARQGCDVSVYCVEKGGEPPVLPDASLVKGRCFELTLPLNNPGVSLQFARTANRQVREFDVVHVHAIWNFPSWWTMRAASAARVPYMVAPQGSLDPWALAQNPVGKKLYGSVTEIPLLRRVTRIQALTAKEAQQVRDFGIAAPVEIIPNGIDESLLEHVHASDPARFDLPEDCRTLLFLSRVHPKKGLDLLVDAMVTVREEVPEVRVVVAGGDAGSGYLETIKATCAAKGLADRFVFLGELKGEDKFRTLSAADAFVLPSYSEGLPVAVLEALGSALPVVVTDMCNLPEIGEVGAGYVVTTTAAQIADAIRRLFSLPLESRRAMGGNARSLAARFTWKRIAGQTIACYETMIAKNSARIDARWR